LSALNGLQTSLLVIYLLETFVDMNKLDKPSTYYHVSMHDHGQHFKFVPRTPELAFESKEGDIPRICVCPDVFYCLRGISGQKRLFSMDIILKATCCENGRNPPAIYVTKKIAYLPPNVSDFRRNHEYWYVHPVVMDRIGYLDLVALTKGKIRILKKYKPMAFTDLSGEGKDVLILEIENVQDGSLVELSNYFSKRISV
jgi:hypothetical protein